MGRIHMTLAVSRAVLDDETSCDPARAGGKGAALARLKGAFDVPEFFVISPDAFDEAGLHPDATRDIDEALERLGPGPFAVRSSGLEEDGAHAAHAGQFLTELNVARAHVCDAAARVWRSGFTQSLSEYRRAHGLDSAPQPPAVVVQVMVAPRAAGVAFSACPVTGARDVVVISAVEGLADALVSGDVDGDSYRIGADGATLEAIALADAPLLSDADRRAVAALARRAADAFGAPQDVEWAIDLSGRLYLLQSRPITTLPDPPPPGVDDPALAIWDNSNIVESYAGVASPLTFSFARYVYAHVYRAFSRLMGVPEAAIAREAVTFETMLGRVDGRVYYNLLSWYRALALFPGFKTNRRFMEEMMGVAEALPPELAEAIAPAATTARERLADRLRLLRVGLGLIVHALLLPSTIRRFETRLNAALAGSNAKIAALPASALAAEYRALETQLLARWDAPLINDFLCMIAFGASRKALEKYAGADGLALHADMMIGQGDIVSAEPARLIRAMGARAAETPGLAERLAAGDPAALDIDPALRAQFDRYLDKFGDRCTRELKLESLTLHEDPRPALMAIAAAARPGPLAVERSAFDAKTRLRALMPGKPVERMLALALLKWAKARVRDRENLRFERTRLFGRVRRIFLALGARFHEAGMLDDPRDVFFLTVEEALGIVEGASIGENPRALARLRRGEDEASSRRPDPPERFTSRGLRSGPPPAETVAATGDETRRTGLACCAGIVTARVRVIEDPRTEALEAGEILVARHTDPGWIAVFANSAGVIAERGSLLSHSAIVAREMGVPCVVALKGATSWLKTGDCVRLDGGAGSVEKVA